MKIRVHPQNDTIHPPGDHACAFDEAVDAGLSVERCFLADVGHTDMVPAGISAAIEFVQSGELVCPPEASSPTCE